MGVSDSTVKSKIPVHSANPRSMPGIPYGPLSPPAIIPKCRARVIAVYSPTIGTAKPRRKRKKKKK